MENKNDWFATIFLNPTKDIDSFVAAGLTSDNTVIYDKDYYKSIDAVKQKFTDTNGVFDENAFDKFYDSTLRTYNSFIQDSLIGKNVSKCTVCGCARNIRTQIGWNFCPVCGAKMGLED